MKTGRRAERAALADILEYAKAIRDLSDIGTATHASWARVVSMAYEALGQPSMAKIDEIRDAAKTPTEGPSREFIEKALAAEDATESFSVGGLMADLEENS